MVLCKLERSISELCFLCFDCENLTVFENMRSTENFVHTKSTSCIHVKLCKLIFPEVKSTKTAPVERNFIEVLKTGNVYLSLVHPADDKKKKLPGIVVLNSRTTKPKCHTCQGKKCVHVNIYRDGASKPDDVDRNVEEELPSKKLELLIL